MLRQKLTALILGAFCVINFSQAAQVSTVSMTASGYDWEIHFPAPDQYRINDHGIELQDWPHTINDRGHVVPVISRVLNTRHHAPQITLRMGNLRYLSPDSAPQLVTESAKGLDLSPPIAPQEGDGLLHIRQISSTPGGHSYSISIDAAWFDESTSQWVIPESISLQITSDLVTSPANDHTDLFINHSSANYSTLAVDPFAAWGKMKLYVLEDGIYRIFYDSLRLTEDFPADELIMSQSLRLVHRGEDIPLHVQDGGDGMFGQGDYFDFIGRMNYFSGSTQHYDPFTDINVYWLDWGSGEGRRFIEESGALQSSNPVRPTSFWDNVHIEKDSVFDRLGQVDTDLPTISRDHFFWTSLNSGQNVDVNFFLPDPATGSSEDLQVSLGLHGLTYSETGTAAQHQLYAFINEHSVGQGSWVQQEEYTLVSPAALNLSHNILNSSGSNLLSIFAPVSTEPGNYDRIVLNWMEIGYEHKLQAHHDRLTFRKSHINPSTLLEFEITGFTSPELVLYKEGVSRITGYSIRENWEGVWPEFSLVFQDQVSDATPDYWIASTAGLLTPKVSVMDTLADLRRMDGDLIVITIPEFMNDLDEYLLFKEGEGYNPVAVSVVDIYDEFNYGINSPYAIRDFLKYAHQHWPSRPRFALLIGDAISNPRQAKRDVRVRNIPTFYMQTYGWGAAEADYWYSLLEGDDYIPDMNIGRLPCNDSEALETSLDKIIRYGSNDNYGFWQNEIITIAGFETTFKNQSESLLMNQVPQDMLPSRIFIDRDSEGQIFWGDTDSLVAHWNRGKLLINFLGHGGGAVWADRSLFVRDDIQYLDPQTPPAFVTSMTCFTASFAQTRGLGEVVMTESPAGAIGWFGSSGVGWIINDYLMIQPLLSRLLSESGTVGELINSARMEYYLANSGYDYLKPSMLFQYNYLGDPTTVLKRPESSDLLSSSKLIYESDEQLLMDFTGSGEGLLRLLPIDAQNHPWMDPLDQDVADSQSFLINPPAVNPDGPARTIYSFDTGRSFPLQKGKVEYSVNAPWFQHTPPAAGDLHPDAAVPIQLSYISHGTPPDSITLSFFGGNYGNYRLEFQEPVWSLSDTVRLGLSPQVTQYMFRAWLNGSVLHSSPVFTLFLPSAITLTINDIRPSINADVCGLELYYSMDGSAPGQASLQLSVQGGAPQSFEQMSVHLIRGNGMIFLPSFFGAEPQNVTAILSMSDSYQRVSDTLSVQFLTSLRRVLPAIGITSDGLSRDTLTLWSNQRLTVTSEVEGWIDVSAYLMPVQANAGIVRLEDSLTYRIDYGPPGMEVSLSGDQVPFLKAFDLPLWQSLDAQGMQARIRTPGFLALGVKQDHRPPEQSMMIAGQLFFDGDYLLGNSQLNILAEDNVGFRWSREDVAVELDGSPIEVTLGDTSESGKILSIIAHLDMDEGEHEIRYRVSDALNNWTEYESIRGVVSGSAQIKDYGNFPNPFEGETLIIYELTQPMQDIQIDIYTVAGHKIHTIDAFNARVGIPLGAIGYHEVPWNGRDRHEDFVANGVYYYRISGESNGSSLEGPIGKMVKNR